MLFRSPTWFLLERMIKRLKDHCLQGQSNRWPLLRRQCSSHVTSSVLISHCRALVAPLHPLHLEYLPPPILGHFSHAGQSENFSAVFKPKLGQESVLLGVGAVGCGFHGRSRSATSKAGWTPAMGLPTPGQRLLRPQGSSALPV